MAATRQRLSAGAARRIALAAQGFDRPRPSARVDIRHLRRVIRRLGLLQLDFVNVLVWGHRVEGTGGHAGERLVVGYERRRHGAKPPSNRPYCERGSWVKLGKSF